MAKRGDGDLAVAIACYASVFGGMVGALALLLLAPPLSSVALAFGPVEYLWLSIFGLSLIASLSTGNVLKGLAGGAFGLLLSCVGVAEISADIRLTFGSSTMIGGIEVVGALIGLYCIPVLIDLVATPERHLKVEEGGRAVRFREAANNATVGGGFIPTLVLGIPGTPPDAVILGALLVQGVRTGPTLFEGGGSIVYTFIFGLFIATILMLPTGLLIGRYAYKTIVTIPKTILVPAVGFMTIIGTFAIRNSISDVIIMIALGSVGWVLSRFGFAASPIVLGLILGPIAEQGFVQAWIIGDATGNLVGMFFGRPISLAIIAFTILSLLYPAIQSRRARRLLKMQANSND